MIQQAYLATGKESPDSSVQRFNLLATSLIVVSCVVGSFVVADESLSAEPPLSAERRQPNVVVILADDLGYGELGCQGNRQIPTPHIDSIASQGVRFTAGYVTGPNCSPSRAGLLTGRYGTRFGHEFNPIGAKNEDPAFGLPLTETTLAEVLRDAGYVTCAIGKWHLGGAARYHPQRRGFDSFFGFMHEGHFYLPAPWVGAATMLRRRALPGGRTWPPNVWRCDLFHAHWRQ